MESNVEGRNVIPIGSAKKPTGPVARGENGRPVTLAECTRMLAEQHGFESNLLIDPPRFEVSMSYLDGAMPKAEFGLFLVINDGGFPFLLGGTRTSFGLDVRYNGYIHRGLENDLRSITSVEVVEIAGVASRAYRVPLLHCFE